MEIPSETIRKHLYQRGGSDKFMKPIFWSLTAALLLCAGAQAATVSSTLTLTGTTTLSGANYVMAGQVTLTNVGSGTFASTIDLTKISGTSVSAPFTITLSGGTLVGTYTEPVAVLTGAGGNAAATITGGTGSYAGYTGSFPTLAVSSTISGVGSYTMTFTGAGTVNTSGGTTTPVPTITAVLDGASNTPNIAQGSIFIVKGSNLSASGYTPFAAAPHRCQRRQSHLYAGRGRHGNGRVSGLPLQPKRGEPDRLHPAFHGRCRQLQRDRH